MGRNVLADEGRNVARKAERAQEKGDFRTARELYLKAVVKFREASEIADDFNEINIIRSLASYYHNCASILEKELPGNPVPLKPEKKESHATDVFLLLEGTGISEQVLEAVVKIAAEISSEGREGRHIGTAFIVGDSASVMAKSRQLILNPFEGHKKEERMITDHEIKGNIKEFAQLDGVFVISADGVVLASGRYITIDTGSVRILKGLGTRHSSVAAITSVTKAIGVVVSQSGGIIRIFRDGRIVVALKP